MKNFLKSNSLSITFLLLFLVSITGQVFCGFKEFNKEMTEEGVALISFGNYLHSGHFIQSTFENWESEFLQMALFVVLTIFLRQKGSSESKESDIEEVDREPNPKRKGAPWSVRQGGWALSIYKYSLTIAFSILFLSSLVLHFYGSLKDENNLLLIKGMPLKTTFEYLGSSRFWFESFQNWQSEFMSVFAIVVLSVFLRQKGSPQSKPVDAPNSETGE